MIEMYRAVVPRIIRGSFGQIATLRIILQILFSRDCLDLSRAWGMDISQITIIHHVL
jgi:hypothetical protein